MSYFTSLFAVQVDTFLKTPPWAFGVMCKLSPLILKILQLILDRKVGASSLISMTLAVYAFYSDDANALVKRGWEHVEGTFRSFKDAEGSRQSQGNDRSASGRLNWFQKLEDYWRALIHKLAWSETVCGLHAKALHLRAKISVLWPFRSGPDTTLPRFESTTASGPSDSNGGRPEKLRRFSLGMRLTPLAHKAREWLTVRRQRRANNGYRASSTTHPAAISLERQPEPW